MIILDLLGILIPCVFIYLWVTQIIIPTYRGTKCFPIFKKQGKLEADLVAVKQEVSNEALNNHIKTIKKRVRNERKKSSSSV